MVSAVLIFRRVARTVRYAMREEDFGPVLSAGVFLLVLGTVTYALGADWNPVDALYFAAAALTTTSVADPDLVLEDSWLKLFTVFYQLIGIGILVEILRRLGMAFVVVRAQDKGGALQLEHRLHVDDRGAVHGFEGPHVHARAVDRQHLDLVQPDRVRPVGGAGAEHSTLGIGGVVARVHSQDVAVGAVEPGQHDHAVPGPEPVESLEHARLEREPRVGRSLVALLRRGRPIRQGRLDPPDRDHLEASRRHART